MLRGVNGHNLFFDNRDRCRFCLLLQEASEQHAFQIHAFCFMTNHIHLILEPNRSSLQDCVHAFSFRYAQYFNRRYKRKGYLFQGRFRSILVEDGEYLKRLTRYVHRNPIESNLVKNAEEYLWSSYRSYLGLQECVWLTKDFILSRFGVAEEAISNFKDFIELNKYAQMDLEEISKAHYRGAYGSTEFIKSMIPETAVKQFKKEKIPLEDVLEKVCEKLQVTKEELASQSKNSRIVDARSVIAYMGRSMELFSISSVAKALGKNDGTLSRLASRANQRSDLKQLAIEIF